MDKKFIYQSEVDACEIRQKSVENAMAIMLSASNGPDEAFMDVLDSAQVDVPRTDFMSYITIILQKLLKYVMNNNKEVGKLKYVIYNNIMHIFKKICYT